MSDVTLLTCPKCKNSNWNDIPDSDDQVKTKFTCSRCGYTVLIGACSVCKKKAWSIVQGIQEGGPHRPIYRLQCGGCRRIIGVKIDHP